MSAHRQKTVPRTGCGLFSAAALLCFGLAASSPAASFSALAEDAARPPAVESRAAEQGMFTSEGFMGVPVVFDPPPEPEPAPAPKIPTVWEALSEKLVADGFDPAYLADVFCRLGDCYSPAAMGAKVLELYRLKQKRLKPREEASEEDKVEAAGKGALPGISPGVLTHSNMRSARKFMAEHKAELQNMEQRFGVEPEIAVSILLVETGLGTFLGQAGALQSLASMAVSRDPEAMRPYLKDYDFTDSTLVWLQDVLPRRADWAYKELKALLAYGRDQGADIVRMPGSVYGAVGLCQFMPSNIEAYGVDATGKGWTDLFTVPDALHSLANYLQEHGWRAELSAADKHGIIMRYNHSARYANTIITVAEYLKTPEGTPLPAVAYQGAEEKGGYKVYKYKPPRTPVKPRVPTRQGRYYGDVPLP